MRGWYLSPLLLIVAGACHQKPPPTQGCQELVGLHSHNPVADASAALKRGDARILTLGGFTSEAPGVGNRLWTKWSTRELQGTSDVETGACFDLRPTAKRYAHRYNRTIVALSGNAIPLDHTTGFRDGSLVKVTRRGDVVWNGQDLDDARLNDYLREMAGRYAKAPTADGHLWVEFEPGVSSDRAFFVRQQVIASGLCRVHRCVEGRWGVKRPVVN